MYESTRKNGPYVAMFEGGPPIVVMTVAEAAKTPASKLAEAFEKVFGREVSLPSEAESGYATREQVDRDMDVWGAAWDIAKKNEFR